MNEKFKSGDVYLWCDAQQSDSHCESRASNHESSDRDRDRSPVKKKSTKRHEKEEEIDETFKGLKQKHGEKYSGPQLRLWARMIANGLHESINDPPQVPMITGHVKKKGQESLSEALAGAAVAFAKAFSSSPVRSSQSTSTLSPCKAAELRMKHLEQLKYLQQLMEDGVLSESEFIEQKQAILDALRNIQ